MTAEEEGSNGDWDENRKLVLWRLQAIDRRLVGLERSVTALSTQVSSLTIRASIMGGLAGLLVAGIVAAIARHYLG